MTSHLLPRFCAESSFITGSFVELCAGWTARPGKRIVLVDDEDEVRKLLRAFLELEGHTVFACSDGLRALEVCRRTRPLDLLITDLQMPGLSGAELADRLAQFAPSVPILIVSGAFLPESTVDSFAARGWSFLAKPFPVPALLQQVHRMTEARQASTPVGK